MHTVVIEGSRTPCGDLPTGVRRTVEVDDRVRRRVAYGYYVVVGGSLDEAPEPVVAEPASVPVENVDTSQVTADSDIPAKDIQANVTPAAPPALDATREEWAAFLDNHKPPIDYPPVAARDDLIIIWQQASGGS